MASKHQLSLDIPETNNCQVFRVFDTSLYTEDLEVTCGTLQITSPGFNEPVNIEVLKGFNLILNACTLGIQTSLCGTVSQRLPDGIYTVRYSVSPNDKVYVEYQYLRVCQTLNKYFNFLCRLEMAACEPQADVKANLEELRMIRSFIDAAKVKVEYCESPQQGMDLFLYAQNRLQRFGKDCC
jgi:hypothetical protein